jgi:hypothetical protein
MTNSFCGFLSNGLFISDKVSRNLNFSPCCLYKGGVDSIDKINWRNINGWTDACNDCYIKELGQSDRSRRHFGNTFDKNFNNNEILFLDIDYSNACNAACGICNSTYSSSIAKLERLENKNPIVPNIKQEFFLEKIRTLNLANLQTLKFIGGEPLYINFNKKILNLIKYPENVEVLYQSNGSIYPDEEWWNLASKFKNIDMVFSIDGIGERFNYIRSNLDYQRVEDNILKIISDNRIKITCGIHYTVNPLNAFYFDEIFSLVKKMKKYNSKTVLNWHPCNNNWDLSNTTPLLRKKIIRKYNNKLFSNTLISLPFNVDCHKKFTESIKLHEQRFNKNGSQIFSEIYEDAMNY